MAMAVSFAIGSYIEGGVITVSPPIEHCQGVRIDANQYG